MPVVVIRLKARMRVSQSCLGSNTWAMLYEDVPHRSTAARHLELVKRPTALEDEPECGIRVPSAHTQEKSG